MPSIFVMAAVTLLGSALLWGGFLYLLSGRSGRYLWLIAPALPLSALVNLAVKRPLAVGVGQGAGIEPGLGLQTPLWFILFLWLLPPVTEEAIKVSPLLLPRVRRMVEGPSTALWAGMGLGIGFGLGEAAFLAYGVAQSPQYAGLPWYTFTGYLGERTAVCLVHAILTGLVVTGVRLGSGHAVAGYLAALLLHGLVNLGPVLSQLQLIPPWGVSSLFAGTLVLLALLFERLRRGATRDAAELKRAGEVVLFRR